MLCDHHRRHPEVFESTPTAQIEGALGEGATTWRHPEQTYAVRRAGYVSASMLGLGRAMGETLR